MAIDKKIMLMRKGFKRSLPQAAPLGELLYCKDTNDLYVGTGSGVQQLVKGSSSFDGGNFIDIPTVLYNVADGGEFDA